MDHHFIPQFYLRGVRDPNVPDGQEPWLWIADFEEGTVQRRAPKNVGKKANDYAFPEVEAVVRADLAKMVLQESAGHSDYFDRTLREALKGQDLSAEQVEDLRPLVMYRRQSAVDLYRSSIAVDYGPEKQ